MKESPSKRTAKLNAKKREGFFFGIIIFDFKRMSDRTISKRKNHEINAIKYCRNVIRRIVYDSQLVK